MDKQQEQISKIRHSLAHLLASAAMEFLPKTKLGIGPVIENGFYYDFDFSEVKIANPKSETLNPKQIQNSNLQNSKQFTLTPNDLQKIETRMKEMIRENQKFSGKKISKSAAKKLFKNQPYKLELIKELPGKTVGIYQNGNFTDLCKGGHAKDTKEINPNSFKLTKIAGAYWKGDEKNKMLTRIYGVAFETEKELTNYLEMEKEAEKRDHRILGEKLKIFAFSDLVGPGLPLWLPNGAIMIDELEKLAKEMEDKDDYLRVRTPHIAKEIMYKTSEHLPYYADSMFPPMILKEGKQKTVYYLKAMNCPHHHQIYKTEKRSYRDLPLRLTEYGTCYRYEKSGELFGLMRVRSMQMNDAHIYCSEEQFAEEFWKVIKLYLKYFEIFGIKKYVMRLSTHSKEGLGKKYIDNEKLWKKTEKMTRDVLVKQNIPFKEVSDEAAFYGPKIDVEIWSTIGKEFTLATNQVDFAVPEKFSLTYTDKDGKEKTPICIHRAPLSTHERFIGFLIEHYAGAFPLWLSPIQTAIIPISDKHLSYAKEIAEKFKIYDLRFKIYGENETLGKKIRIAETEKIPYLLIIGDKEIQTNSVSVRERGKGDVGTMKLEEFIEKVKGEIYLKK